MTDFEKKIRELITLNLSFSIFQTEYHTLIIQTDIDSTTALEWEYNSDGSRFNKKPIFILCEKISKKA